jgi:hypothetical protein
MGDSFITLVPNPVKSDEVGNLSRRTTDWLIANKIILPSLSDCILGKGKGYAPGQNCKDIIEGDDFGLTGPGVNGLEVITNRRVFDNGGNGLEEMNCPHCGTNNIGLEWGEMVDGWHRGENDLMKCMGCNKATSIIDYEFVPALGFGEFGITFWNWPKFNEKFLSDLKRLLNKDIKVIYCRV